MGMRLDASISGARPHRRLQRRCPRGIHGPADAL